MKKRDIATIAQKNRIVQEVIRTIVAGGNFLILGHQNADEDCIASMVAISLLIKKLNKTVSILLTEQINDRYLYLLNICRYNAINIIPDCSSVAEEIDTICVVDTPKPVMVQTCRTADRLLKNPAIPVIELDHHLAADSAYIGDRHLSLVAAASSTCELIGYLALKMQLRRNIIEGLDVDDLFTRNFVLAVLTGIVGDSKMGKFIKSRRERWFYNLFSSTFSKMLQEKTAKGSSNLSTMEEVFEEITRLSRLEERCFTCFMEHKKETEFIHYTILPPDSTDPLPPDTDLDLLISTARSVADALAEESGYMGMVVYHDPPEVSDLIQFRLRRSHTFNLLDLRSILSAADIENGGGHEGAIGFRIPKSHIGDIHTFMERLFATIQSLMPGPA